jgi:hypothetical protein
VHACGQKLSIEHPTWIGEFIIVADAGRCSSMVMLLWLDML